MPHNVSSVADENLIFPKYQYMKNEESSFKIKGVVQHLIKQICFL